MTTSTILDEDAKKRLQQVLTLARGDIFSIRSAVVEALKGVNDRGRRTYLWGQLTRRAAKKISEGRRRKEPSMLSKKADGGNLVISPYMRADAKERERRDRLLLGDDY